MSNNEMPPRPSPERSSSDYKKAFDQVQKTEKNFSAYPVTTEEERKYVLTLVRLAEAELAEKLGGADEREMARFHMEFLDAIREKLDRTTKTIDLGFIEEVKNRILAEKGYHSEAVGDLLEGDDFDSVGFDFPGKSVESTPVPNTQESPSKAMSNEEKETYLNNVSTNIAREIGVDQQFVQEGLAALIGEESLAGMGKVELVTKMASLVKRYRELYDLSYTKLAKELGLTETDIRDKAREVGARRKKESYDLRFSAREDADYEFLSQDGVEQVRKAFAEKGAEKKSKESKDSETESMDRRFHYILKDLAQKFDGEMQFFLGRQLTPVEISIATDKIGQAFDSYIERFEQPYMVIKTADFDGIERVAKSAGIRDFQALMGYLGELRKKDNEIERFGVELQNIATKIVDDYLDKQISPQSKKFLNGEARGEMQQAVKDYLTNEYAPSGTFDYNAIVRIRDFVSLAKNGLVNKQLSFISSMVGKADREGYARKEEVRKEKNEASLKQALSYLSTKVGGYGKLKEILLGKVTGGPITTLDIDLDEMLTREQTAALLGKTGILERYRVSPLTLYQVCLVLRAQDAKK